MIPQAFVKVVKNKSFFSRYQVKYRRRREGKTDYHARRRLVTQDRNKYSSHRYRLIVRRSNKDVTVQIAYSKIAGDVCMVAAYSHELPKFGLPVGLTNYAAHYATGLLAARRILKKLKLDEHYKGHEEVTGEDYNVEESIDGPRPFKALLDVGLARTTTGARLFAAMKGAADGGLNIPHSEKRFAGYDPEGKSLDAEFLRARIFGNHVADWMKQMKEDDEGKFKAQFSRYIKAGITAENLEEKIKACHAAIRANPDFTSTKKAAPAKGERKRFGKLPLNRAQREDKIKQKIANNVAKMQSA